MKKVSKLLICFCIITNFILIASNSSVFANEIAKEDVAISEQVIQEDEGVTIENDPTTQKLTNVEPGVSDENKLTTGQIICIVIMGIALIFMIIFFIIGLKNNFKEKEKDKDK